MLPFYRLRPMPIHVHQHTHVHTCRQAHTDTSIHAISHTQIQIHIHIQVAYTHIHTCTDTHTNAQAVMHNIKVYWYIMVATTLDMLMWQFIAERKCYRCISSDQRFASSFSHLELAKLSSRRHGTSLCKKSPLLAQKKQSF